MEKNRYIGIVFGITVGVLLFFQQSLGIATIGSMKITNVAVEGQKPGVGIGTFVVDINGEVMITAEKPITDASKKVTYRFVLSPVNFEAKETFYNQKISQSASDCSISVKKGEKQNSAVVSITVDPSEITVSYEKVKANSGQQSILFRLYNKRYITELELQETETILTVCV